MATSISRKDLEVGTLIRIKASNCKGRYVVTSTAADHVTVRPVSRDGLLGGTFEGNRLYNTQVPRVVTAVLGSIEGYDALLGLTATK
jgi:hypothetical protein